MGIKYLWDTNTVIYYLQQQFPDSAEKFIDNTLEESWPAISVISEIELMCWSTPKEEDFKVLENFVEELKVYELDKEIKRQTAKIRKTHRIKLPDAIIAATALAYDLVLLTRNVKDFQKIDGMGLVNPYEK